MKLGVARYLVDVVCRVGLLRRYAPHKGETEAKLSQ
jgi:hypothetical protein